MKIIAATLTSIALCLMAGGGASVETADRVFKNGNI